MENKALKGCVYFFKHVGLSPIKIGFSTNESPINRFEQFKTYAPYGSELIGFIRTHNAKELETELHLKFSNYRLKGEWFDLSIEEVNKWISFYSSIEDIEEENNFRVAWAKTLNIRLNPLDEFNFRNFFTETDIYEKRISNNDIFKLYEPFNSKNIGIKLLLKRIVEYCNLNKLYFERGNSNGKRYFYFKR